MPTYYPEGDTSKPQDDEKRSLAKLCSIVFADKGSAGTGVFPEGTAPKPQDCSTRLKQKIVLMLNLP